MRIGIGLERETWRGVGIGTDMEMGMGTEIGVQI